jgi:hypothetical protein
MADTPATPLAAPAFSWTDTLANLLNKGVDVAGQLAAANLTQRNALNQAKLQAETANANREAAAAEAGTAYANLTAQQAAAPKYPAWLMPVGLGLGALALLGVLLVSLRKK